MKISDKISQISKIDGFFGFHTETFEGKALFRVFNILCLLTLILLVFWTGQRIYYVYNEKESEVLRVTYSCEKDARGASKYNIQSIVNEYKPSKKAGRKGVKQIKEFLSETCLNKGSRAEETVLFKVSVSPAKKIMLNLVIMLVALPFIVVARVAVLYVFVGGNKPPADS